ncbi:anti-sigma factor family protein [Mycobacterium adipatum]|uniref:anti-sigma factor family protein n=1 Tax=Mycobacterium adipatum TaxID=1682113 RepID=UPI000B31A75C|nr:zf-HC2 domain-containing protein [Mycobacterium adipatum]
MSDAESLDCIRLVELVTDYLDGVLDLDTRARFDRHLGECEGCHNYLQQLRSTVGVLGKVDSGQLDPAFRERLLAAFRDWR